MLHDQDASFIHFHSAYDCAVVWQLSTQCYLCCTGYPPEIVKHFCWKTCFITSSHFWVRFCVAFILFIVLFVKKKMFYIMVAYICVDAVGLCAAGLGSIFCCFRLRLFSNQQTLHCSQPEHTGRIPSIYYTLYYGEYTTSYRLP